MSSFLAQLEQWTAKTERTLQTVFVASCADAKDSIQNGSALTGSPGQPVDEGELKASWELNFESPTVAVISTNTPYAESNEDGIARPDGGAYVQRSTVGGRWSLRKTILGWPRIVDASVARLVK